MVVYKFDRTNGVGELIFNHLVEGYKKKINKNHFGAGLSFDAAFLHIKFQGIDYLECFMEKVNDTELKDGESIKLFENADPPYALFKFDESKVEKYDDRDVFSRYWSRS